LRCMVDKLLEAGIVTWFLAVIADLVSDLDIIQTILETLIQIRG